MTSVNGFFRNDAAYITARVRLQDGFEREFNAFVDNGSQHIILFLNRARVPEAVIDLIEQCPEEPSTGLGGAILCRRVPQALLELGSPGSTTVLIEADPLHVYLFDPADPHDDWVYQFPPLILGFAHRTFGRSRLTIDNGEQSVEIEYRDPPTRFRY